MTFAEILAAQGIDEDKVKAIADEMKKNKIFTAGEENLDIRYKDLQAKYDTKDKEHQAAAQLIEQLKKENSGNSALQQKVTGYESQVSELQQQLQQTKADAALKVALLEAKVADIDYVAFKVREKGEIQLDDNGKIKGIDDTLAALKTQFPTQFPSTDGKDRKIDEIKLPDGKHDHDCEPVSLADAIKQSYEKATEE